MPDRSHITALFWYYAIRGQSKKVILSVNLAAHKTLRYKYVECQFCYYFLTELLRVSQQYSIQQYMLAFNYCCVSIASGNYIQHLTSRHHSNRVQLFIPLQFQNKIVFLTVINNLLQVNYGQVHKVPTGNEQFNLPQKHVNHFPSVYIIIF